MNVESKCPMHAGKGGGDKVEGAAVLFEMTNRLWWPNQLDLSILHQNPPALDPMGGPPLGPPDQGPAEGQASHKDRVGDRHHRGQQGGEQDLGRIIVSRKRTAPAFLFIYCIDIKKINH